MKLFMKPTLTTWSDQFKSQLSAMLEHSYDLTIVFMKDESMNVIKPFR